MKLLIEEGCFDEARSQYEQCQRALARYEKQPAKHLQALNESLNTLDITPLVQTTRREFLQIVASSTGMLSTSTSQDANETDHELLERLAHALKKPSTVDTLFLSHLESVTKNNRKRFVLSKNSLQDIHSMYQDASAHLRSITQLLEHPLASSPYIQLCSLAGETAQLLGDILFHQGKDEEAERIYHMAMQAAATAHNEVLQAVILGRKSFLPLYRGEPTRALSFLRQAHLLSAHHASDAIRAWLLTIEAEAWATVGNTEACEEALMQSELLLHRATSKVSTCAFSVEPLYAPLNNERLLGYMGACYLRLHQPQKAQPLLHTYLASMRYASIHKQSITLVDLAKTYALQGDLEAMAHYVGSAYHLLEQTQSTRVFERLVDLRRLVGQWKDTIYVKQFDQQLATLAYARQLKPQGYTK
jgi:tetratricopeptide (TPR) repeat protein